MTYPIIINSERCIGCGLCVDVCPYRIITLEAEKAVIDTKDCFLCGHCRAVCPAEAVEIKNLSESIKLETLQLAPEKKEADRLSSESLISLMDSRRSCRNYKTDNIPEPVLHDLARIGSLAPSGTNCQSWQFTILPERTDVLEFGNSVAGYYQKLNKLAARPYLKYLLKSIGQGSLLRYYKNYYESVEAALAEWEDQKVDRLFHGATAAILVSGKKGASCPKEDALLATQNILLAAHSLGLGSCLIGFAVEAIRRSHPVKKQVGIPDDEQVYSVICLGYPAINYLRPAGRNTLRPRIVRLVS